MCNIAQDYHVLSLIKRFVFFFNRVRHASVFVVAILVTTVLFAARWQRIRIAHTFNVLSTKRNSSLISPRLCSIDRVHVLSFVSSTMTLHRHV